MHRTQIRRTVCKHLIKIYRYGLYKVLGVTEKSRSPTFFTGVRREYKLERQRKMGKEARSRLLPTHSATAVMDTVPKNDGKQGNWLILSWSLQWEGMVLGPLYAGSGGDSKTPVDSWLWWTTIWSGHREYGAVARCVYTPPGALFHPN